MTETTQIRNVDELVGGTEDVRAVLGGVEFHFPPDPPVDLYLPFVELEEEIQTQGLNAERLAQAKAYVLRLVQVRQPDVTELPAALGLRATVQAFGAIYRPAATEDDGGDGEDPTVTTPGTPEPSPSPS